MAAGTWRQEIYWPNPVLRPFFQYYKEINRQNRELTLIFSFKAAAAFSFLTFPLKEITDRSLPLADVLGPLVLEWKSMIDCCYH